MTWAETYGQGPGQVENYLSWIGADRSGTRGIITASHDAPATMSISGEVEVLQNLSRLISQAHDQAVARLETNCEFILSESKKEVPWKSTHLRQSGTVEPVPYSDEFEIGYAGPYALRQHEDMTLHHPKPGTKAKYLEDPAMRIAPTIAEDITNYLSGVLL